MYIAVANKRALAGYLLYRVLLLCRTNLKGVIFMNDNEKLHGAANRINRNLQHQLSVQKKFGQSKHEAKQKAREDYLQKHGNLKGYNPSKVDGIFSFKTMESYSQTAKEFEIVFQNYLR